MADKIADPPAIISFTKTWHSKPYPFISPTRPELSASGKNVIVTGGGTGIGKAIAIAFAQAGAKSVAILGRRLDRLKTSATAISAAASERTDVLYETADLMDRTQVDTALKSITDKVGKIDIFVSNAGALPEPGPILGYNAATFMRGFELNVLSAFNAIQAFMPLAGPEPVLLSISTASAHFAPMPGFAAYSASKAANLKMVDYLAAENPQLHVVNIQPGWIPTEANGMRAEAPDVGMLLFHCLTRVSANS